MSESIDHITIGELFKLLPHRYPFLLIDRIERADGDDFAVGIKNVTFNEPHFNGHFPGEPIMPGVLIVEAMAQTCGAIVAHKHADGVRKLVYFMTIDGAKFRKPVLPGDTLFIESEITRMRSSIGSATARCTVNGQVVSEAELMFSVVSR